MLVLTRKVGNSIVIGSQIKIQVVQIQGRQVRLGISAPKEIKVNREELLHPEKVFKAKEVLQTKEVHSSSQVRSQGKRDLKAPSPNSLSL